MSMDGFVAGPIGEHDWIVMDPSFDFEGYMKEFDTIEVAVMPIALSHGIPLLPAGERSPQLHLLVSKALPSGVVTLNYSIFHGAGAGKSKKAGKPGKSVKH